MRSINSDEGLNVSDASQLVHILLEKMGKSQPTQTNMRSPSTRPAGENLVVGRGFLNSATGRGIYGFSVADSFRVIRSVVSDIIRFWRPLQHVLAMISSRTAGARSRPSILVVVCMGDAEGPLFFGEPDGERGATTNSLKRSLKAPDLTPEM